MSDPGWQRAITRDLRVEYHPSGRGYAVDTSLWLRTANWINFNTELNLYLHYRAPKSLDIGANHLAFSADVNCGKLASMSLRCVVRCEAMGLNCRQVEASDAGSAQLVDKRTGVCAGTLAP